MNVQPRCVFCKGINKITKNDGKRLCEQQVIRVDERKVDNKEFCRYISAEMLQTTQEQHIEQAELLTKFRVGR